MCENGKIVTAHGNLPDCLGKSLVLEKTTILYEGSLIDQLKQQLQ